MNATKQTNSLSNHIRGQLLARLSAKEFPVGVHVSAQVIADELSVSKATARVAIEQLVREGWLSAGGNGRPIVAVHPPKSTVQKAKPNEFSSKQDRTRRIIIEKALRHEFQPDQVIKAKPLAVELQVNIQTVREALDWLCREAVVKRLPRRGWQLVRMTLPEIETLFAIRRGIEPMVIQLCIDRIEDETVDDLLAETERLNNAKGRSILECIEADFRFHETLCKAADNAVLEETLRPLIRKLTVIGVTHGFSCSVFPEHARILKALRQRDEKQAIECIKRDLANPVAVGFSDWE